MQMAPFEIDWARAIARALVPAGALGGALDGIDAGTRYAEECAASPWHVGLLLRASLWLTWLAPLWLWGRPRSFAGLDAEAQATLLEKLLAHPRYLVRTATVFLKLVLCQVLLGDEATLAQLGAYDLALPLARRAPVALRAPRAMGNKGGAS
jgi:hypothetical protein